MSAADAWLASLGEDPTVPSPLASSLTGLSLASALSGSSGEYGGGAKRANLLFFNDSAVSSRLCLGFVGSGSRRFCFKVLKGDVSTTCGVGKHARKFEPKIGHFFLRCNDTTAFCEPCFSETLVPVDMRENFKTASKTIDEWKQIFTDYLHDVQTQTGASASSTKFLFPDPDRFALKTPRKVPFFEGEFPSVSIPSELEDIKLQSQKLAIEQFWWEEDDSTSLLPVSLFDFLKLLRGFLVKYETWLVEPLDVLTLRFDTVEGDLHKLKHHCEDLQLAIGRPITIEGDSFPDVWSALEYLSSFSNPSTGGVERLGQAITVLQNEYSGLANSIQTLTTAVTQLPSLVALVQDLKQTSVTYKARFNRIHPFLILIKELKSRIESIESYTASAAGPLPAHTSVPSDPWMANFAPDPGASTPAPTLPCRVISPGNDDTEARIHTIEHQLTSLEKRVVGDGMRVGRFVFQSKEDLRLWLASHLPSNRFGLFLDGVSIFDFLAHTHMDSNENMAHLYNSQKNGFETIYESKIISSMQNLFPNLFGKGGADGMDTSRTLPGLQSSDKWNSDGVTGLQLQVEHELPNVDLQFRNAIASALENSVEARDLALELLYRSKKFALDLSNFMKRDVDFWRHKGYSKQAAWELTCLSVRRIFEDIHVVRVVGRDCRDIRNPATTATQIIWATLRSHLVMEEYSRRNFVEHPSISAVIARHLASHHVMPDDALETKLKKLDDRVSKMGIKMDALESRIARLESKNEIPPPRKGRGGGKLKDKDQDNALSPPRGG